MDVHPNLRLKNRISLVIVILGLVGWWVFYQPSLKSMESENCAKNLQEIITTCEMYSTNHNGRYPEDLAQHGSWTCPQAGTDTYTSAYSLDPETKTFTIQCTDKHWQSLGFREGYPYFNSAFGWCVSPGNYTTMLPDEYLDLHNNPKL